MTLLRNSGMPNLTRVLVLVASLAALAAAGCGPPAATPSATQKVGTTVPKPD